MSTRRQFISGTAAALALTGAAATSRRAFAQSTPTSDDDNGTNAAPVVGTPTLQPAIDLARAQEIALEGNTGAVVTKIELDGDDGVLEYSIRLNNGVEVDIDATTGAIIKTEQSDDDNGNDDNGNDNNGEDDNGGDQGDGGSDDDGGEGED